MGVNVGFGFEIVKYFVSFFVVCVILVVRNIEVGKWVKFEIEWEIGIKGVVYVW